MSHVIDMAHMLAGPITRVTSDKEIFIRQRPIPQPGSGTHYDVGSSEGPLGDVTNEDYVSALVHFENGTACWNRAGSSMGPNAICPLKFMGPKAPSSGTWSA